MLGNLFEEEEEEEEEQRQAGMAAPPQAEARLPPELRRRGPSSFAGLLNQGTTCYLNSLLQTMFMTPELRSGLYQVGKLLFRGARICSCQCKQVALAPCNSCPCLHCQTTAPGSWLSAQGKTDCSMWQC